MLLDCTANERKSRSKIRTLKGVRCGTRRERPASEGGPYDFLLFPARHSAAVISQISAISLPET